MPSLPEFTRRRRKIWSTEVLCQTYSEQRRAPNGDRGIARKVSVDLEREAIRGQKQVPAGSIGRIRIGTVDKWPQIVSDHAFQQKTIKDESQPLSGQVQVEMPRRLQLRQQ